MKKKIIITREILYDNGACLSWKNIFDKWFPTGAEPFSKVKIDEFTKKISKLALSEKVFMYNRSIPNTAMLYYYSLYNILWYSGYRDFGIKLYYIIDRERYNLENPHKLSISKIKKYYLNVIKDKLY